MEIGCVVASNKDTIEWFTFHWSSSWIAPWPVILFNKGELTLPSQGSSVPSAGNATHCHGRQQAGLLSDALPRLTQRRRGSWACSHTHTHALLQMWLAGPAPSCFHRSLKEEHCLPGERVTPFVGLQHILAKQCSLLTCSFQYPTGESLHQRPRQGDNVLPPLKWELWQTRP